MNKAERSKFLQWVNSLTDYELEAAYYNAVFDSLGSEAEEMYERGYDISDIREREKYEKDLIVKSHILEKVCIDRGITLWVDEVDNG